MFLVSLPFVVLDIKTKYNIFTCPRTSGGDVIQTFAIWRLREKTKTLYCEPVCAPWRYATRRTATFTCDQRHNYCEPGLILFSQKSGPVRARDFLYFAIIARIIPWPYLRGVRPPPPRNWLHARVPPARVIKAKKVL